MNVALGRPVIIIDTHVCFIFISENLILPTIYLFFRIGVSKNTKFTIFISKFHDKHIVYVGYRRLYLYQYGKLKKRVSI